MKTMRLIDILVLISCLALGYLGYARQKCRPERIGEQMMRMGTLNTCRCAPDCGWVVERKP